MNIHQLKENISEPCGNCLSLDSAMYARLILASLIGGVLGTTYNFNNGDPVEPDFTGWTDNDLILLSAGTFTISDTLMFFDVKNITISGTINPANSSETLSIIEYPDSLIGGIQGVIMSGQLGGVVINDVTLKSVSGSERCSILQPVALQANFSLELLPSPLLLAGDVIMQVNLGRWYSTREVLDFNYGSCSWSTNSSATKGLAIAENKPLHTSSFYFTHGCNAYIGIQARFDMSMNCSAVRTNYPTLVSYKLPVEAKFTEKVTWISSTKLLRVPTVRSANGVTNLRIVLDRTGTVNATIAVQYQQADLQASITVVNITRGTNHTYITVSLSIPRPFTAGNGGTGTINFTGNADTSLFTTGWTAGPSCNDMNAASCLVDVTFEIFACQLTGDYFLKDIPIGCQADSISQGVCPTIVANTADVRFFLDSKDFCKVSEFNLSDIFLPQIVLRTDNTYAAERTNFTFTLGDQSYWSIRIWTNTTGIQVQSAIVTAAVRTSDGDCNAAVAYQNYFSGARPVPDTFNVNTVPPQIEFALQVSAAMACASSATSSNQVNFTYTVLVDYQDGTQRRRRRDFNHQLAHHLARRKSGAVDVGQDNVGIGYTAENLDQATLQTPTAASSSNTPAVIGAIVAIMLVCCCCIGCGMIGIVVYRRRKRAEEKECVFLPSNTQMLMGTNVVTSTAHLASPNQGNGTSITDMSRGFTRKASVPNYPSSTRGV